MRWDENVSGTGSGCLEPESTSMIDMFHIVVWNWDPGIPLSFFIGKVVDPATKVCAVLCGGKPPENWEQRTVIMTGIWEWSPVLWGNHSKRAC